MEWPATVPLSLLGLYVAVMLFGMLTFTHLHLASGGSVLTIPLVWINTAWKFGWGLTLTGFFLVLWPLAFANHLLVWWCSRQELVWWCSRQEAAMEQEPEFSQPFSSDVQN